MPPSTILINSDASTVFGLSSTVKISDLFSTLWVTGIGIFLGVVVVVLVLYSAFYFADAGSVKRNFDLTEKYRRIILGFLAVVVVVSGIYGVAPSVRNFTFLDLQKNQNSGSLGSNLPINTNPSQPAPLSGGSSGYAEKGCLNASYLKTELSTGGNVCSGTVCKGTCNFDPAIRALVVKESVAAGVDYRFILALACRESSGNPTLTGKLAQNGKPDCGLMQINVDTPTCTPEILDPKNNVRRGIDLYKKKIAALPNISYPGIEKPTMAFAAYNCCSNGDNPNSRSNDCNTSTGFAYDIPKWGCPINPGPSAFNMCKVKNYACDVTACSAKY